MKAGKNKGSVLDDEIEATLPEGMADDPAVDDPLADLNSSDTEVLEERISSGFRVLMAPRNR